MKKLLIIPMLLCILISASCDSSPKKTIPTSNTDYENIIGTPIKIDYLMVAQYDFPNEMNWKDAKAACAKLGKRWRLPTINELNILYENKDEIGGFAGCYISISEFNKYYKNYVWTQYFDSGREEYGAKDVLYNVRAVRRF